MQTSNWTNQCPLFMTVRHIFEISEDDHPPNTPTPLVSHACDHWWTLNFANAFISPGVNSREELVPPHGVSSRRLGDKTWTGLIFTFSLFLMSGAMSGGMAQKNSLSQNRYSMSGLFCDFINEHCLVCTRILVASQEYNVWHLFLRSANMIIWIWAPPCKKNYLSIFVRPWPCRLKCWNLICMRTGHQ
jgi:hypothetical protein